MPSLPLSLITHFSTAFLISFTILIPDVLADHEEDPLESFNRVIFSFNDTLDTYMLSPVAKSYHAVTPEPVQTGIHNVFNNLGEFKNITNNLLQAEFKNAGIDVSRLLINSTLGLLGLFDVGTKMGLPRSQQDFGITLTKWGVNSGPYIVLPLLGPSTLRDGIALVPDALVSPISYLNPEHDSYYLYAVQAIDSRTQLLDAKNMIQGDKYTFIRSVYLSNRNFKTKGIIDDDF